MPTVRTPIGRTSNPRVTPAAVALWKKARAIHDAGGDTGSMDRELNRLLHRDKPWQASVLNAIGDGVPPEISNVSYCHSRDNLEDWHECRAIVEALDRAAGLAS